MKMPEGFEYKMADEFELQNLLFSPLMNLKGKKQDISAGPQYPIEGTKFTNQQEIKENMRQYIDASNAVANGMPIEEVAKKYPLIAERWLNDFRYHKSPEAF